MLHTLLYMYPSSNIHDFKVCSIDGVETLAYFNTAKFGPQPTQAQIDAAAPIAQSNNLILAQIAALEASCTERRWREHITGFNTTFIPGVDAQIAALRGQLK